MQSLPKPQPQHLTLVESPLDLQAIPDDSMMTDFGASMWSLRSVETPEDLNLAAASVVRAAELNLASDSILVDDDDDELELESELDDSMINPSMSNRSSIYIEEASVEVPRHRTSFLAAHPLLVSTTSSGDFDDPCVRAILPPSPTSKNVPRKHIKRPSVVADVTTTATTTMTTEDILQSCGSLTLPLERLREHWRHSEEALVAVLISTRAGLEFQPPSFSSHIRRTVPDPDCLALHSLFATLCSPAPTLQSIQDILAHETTTNETLNGANVPLPWDTVISAAASQKASVVSLLCSQHHLLQLNKPFQLALFRTLIRLLTNETDEEYNEACLYTKDWWDPEDQVTVSSTEHTQDPTLLQVGNLGVLVEEDSSSTTTTSTTAASFQARTHERIHRMRKTRQSVVQQRQRQSRIIETMHQSRQRLASKRPNQLYAIVRFRSGRVWNTSGNSNEENQAVSRILDLFESILDKEESHHLLAPVSRLLGLFCTAAISVKELRRILAMAGDTIPSVGYSSLRRCAMDRLLLVRALATAAEGASQSTQLVGKASPRHFFSFQKGPGLTRTIKSLSSWPFRNDFGMAFWFRAESFVGTEHPKLLSCRAPDGGGIEVTLMPVDGDSKAAVITVTKYDSNAKEEGGVQHVTLKGCLILPRVWYHLAIRHTQSRLKGVFSLSARQILSIILDGKVMLTEPLKFPNVTYSEVEASSPSHQLLGLRRSTNTTTLTVRFGADFEGQAGALYLFNDNISDSTLRALHEVTAGARGMGRQDLLKANTWDSVKGDIARKRASVVEITTADAEEIAMTSTRNRELEILDPTNASIVDLGEEEGSADFPAELNKAALGSKMFLVWDPKRTEGMVTLDLHSGAHVTMDTDKVQPWFVDGAKNVIGSIGGVQSLLPLFQTMLSGTVEREWHMIGRSVSPNDFDPQDAYPLVPNLIMLLSAFLRDHDENAREILRCGGIDIVENFFLENKKPKEHSENSLSYFGESMLGVIARYPGLSAMLLDSLVDLRASCSQYEELETTVFTRLYFNLPLWFDQSQGVGLHMTVLPLLSSITNSSPKKVRDCVGTKPFMEALKQYVQVDKEVQKHISQEAATQLFDRSSMSDLDRRAPLTINERRHAIDIILGMVATILVAGTNPTLLGPLIHYIANNVEYEREHAINDTANGRNPLKRTGERHERHLAVVKATSVLLFLLKGRPAARGLFASLTKICGGQHATSSWILCALVNSFDDELRSLGIRCLAEYLDVEPDMKLGSDPSSQEYLNGNVLPAAESSPKPVGKRLSATFTNMGKGLAAIGGAPLLSSMIHPVNDGSNISYKLLWHLLKSHRTRMGPKTHSSLVNFLLKDRGVVYDPAFLVRQVVVCDDILRTGCALNMNAVDTMLLECESESGKTLRQGQTLNIVLRLIRYLSDEWKEKWLLDLVDLITTCSSNLSVLVGCPEWQPSLFKLISDAVEELASEFEPKPHFSESNAAQEIASKEARTTSQTDNSEGSKRVQARFDLSLKLYTGLLAYCFRQGGEKALHAVEHTASLQRVCANGHEVVCLIMNHLLSNLIEYGTIEAIFVVATSSQDRNRLLKESARIVTNAILASGSNGVDAASAVRQWQSLRYLAAISSAIVTASGFTMGDLFDYSSQSGAAVDNVSKGVYGIRLQENNIPGMNSLEYIKLTQTILYSTNGQERSRRVALAVASQTLALLDAFIFPDSLDASLPTSQLHGLALVRSNEPRLGKSQGPLIASLVRLSLTLLCRLEPSSVKFLQCCSRLRCFVHWSLELIRESVALAGYSAAFHDLTAPLDRLILATVLQCHKSLSKCATLLVEIESSPEGNFFPDDDTKKKNYRRLLRVAFELREVVLAAYRGRNEVLRAALSLQAFEALQFGLEQSVARRVGDSPLSKEAIVRDFLSSSWVTSFHDVEMRDTLAIPEQVASGQLYQHKTSSHRGVLAVEEMLHESNGITADFNRSLDSSFEEYCEDQRKWADSGAVRELEFEGDLTAKKLSSRFPAETFEATRMINQRASNALSRWHAVERVAVDLWNCESCHWQLARNADRLNRRILLTRNRNFDNHESASYELMLGIERDKAIKLREERLRKKEEERLSDVIGVVLRNSGAMVPFREIDDTGNAGGDYGDDDENENDVEDTGMWYGEDHSFERASSSGIEDFLPPATLNSESVFGGVEDVVMVENEDAEIVDADAWAKVFIWSETESIVARFESIMVVTLQTIREGNLLLTTHGIYFKQYGHTTNVMTKETDTKSGEEDAFEHKDMRWRLSRLTEVHGRRFMLRAQAIELFFSDSHELFLNFTSGVRERDRFYAKLRNSCKVPMLWSPKSLNPRVVFKKSKLTQLWRQGKISNFHYLMQLNKMAGRTFNDITQYPVFPWVLSDFTSENIDLRDTRVYRDLSKPVGALNENRLASLIERYNELESFGFAANERFLYGSHYSSPGVVLHYLIRQEPFTTMAIELQSGRFDCPDRLFFDIASCWKSCNTSSSDVKELVPELFTCPEIFLNTNNYPLGRTQDSKNIDNVTLPPWAKGSAYEFVRIHRLALESDYVSQNLHHWIDLIFGYKQRGAEAEAAHNLFHYLSYEGAVDLDKINNDVDRAATGK